MAISQINATPVGKLVTRVTSDVNTVNELFTNVIITVFFRIVPNNSELNNRWKCLNPTKVPSHID